MTQAKHMVYDDRLKKVIHSTLRCRTTSIVEWIVLFRMFVKRPRVMLLDEPFNGLVHFGSKNLKELLQKYLRREDAIIIIVSHTGLENDFVDRVVRLN